MSKSLYAQMELQQNVDLQNRGQDSQTFYIMHII